jgi:hypothetical protein
MHQPTPAQSKRTFALLPLMAALLFAPAWVATAQTIQPPYDSVYTLTDLGIVAGLPTPYGGLDFLPANPNVIVIGGSANNASGALYTIGVVRNGSGQITGFTGTATLFSDGQFNDGGVVFGPGGVLFYTRFPNNEVGEVKPGSVITDKIVDLTALGVNASVGALFFVPGGFPGAGQLKIVSYDTADWYTASYAPDGSGTYNITAPVLNTTIQGGPEGFIYVPVGSPIFPANSMLVSEYGNDVVSTYQSDASGNPIPATRALFVNGLTGAEGAVIDPVTGDFLFSTFGTTNHVIVVRGFAVPPTPTPTTTPGGPTPTQAPILTATPIPNGGGPTAPVPTLSGSTLAVLGMLLAAVAIFVLRRL